jgi:hypothetical protein
LTPAVPWHLDRAIHFTCVEAVPPKSPPSTVLTWMFATASLSATNLLFDLGGDPDPDDLPV